MTVSENPDWFAQVAADAAPALNTDTIDRLRLILGPHHRLALVTPLPQRGASSRTEQRAA